MKVQQKQGEARPERTCVAQALLKRLGTANMFAIGSLGMSLACLV